MDKQERDRLYEQQKKEYGEYLMSKSQEVDSQSSITNILNHYGIQINRNGQCLCPFHQDSKPSMAVERNDKYVHCFVDNKTWYAVNFIKDYEAQYGRGELGFYDRIKMAIDIQGLNIELLSFRDYFNMGAKVLSRQDAKETQHRNIMQDAVDLAKYSLTIEDRFAERGKEYLASRKISQKTIENFNIGIEFNNRIPQILTNERGYTTQQLVDVGLLKVYDNGEVRNVFQQRVLVPICNEFGRPVGFGGRVLDDRKPKYLNTSETEIFHKSDILFNYHQAKTFARNNEIILVEGYFDVISTYEMGMRNVVALMGVALSDRHIEMIKDLNCEVSLCLDNDTAGRNAMIKIIPQLLNNGLTVNVYDTSVLGNLKDFGDFNEQGKTKEEIIETKITGFQFLLKHYYFENRPVDVENVSKVFKELQKDGLINNSVDELKYKEYVAENSSITKEEVEDIIHPKEVSNRLEKAMQIRFIRAVKREVLNIATKDNNLTLIDFIQNDKLTDNDVLVGMNDEKYCSNDGRHLDLKRFTTDYVMNLKEYKEMENDLPKKFEKMLNNVWTYDELKNPIRVWLTNEQKSIVLDQYVNSFPEEEARKEFEDYPELYTKLFIANDENDYELIAKPMSSVLRERWKLEQFHLGRMALVPYNACFPSNLTLEDKKRISNEYITLTKDKDGNPVYYFKSLVVFNNSNEKGKIIFTEQNFIEPKVEETKEPEKIEPIPEKVFSRQTTQKEENKQKSNVIDYFTSKGQRQRNQQSIAIVIPLVKNEYLKTAKGIYIVNPANKQTAIFLENGHFKFNDDTIEFDINHQNSISLYNLEEAANLQTRSFGKRLEKNQFLQDYRNMYYNKQQKEMVQERSV